MATVFQPHIHTAGKVITPDLRLDRLMVAERLGDSPPRLYHVSIDRLTTGAEIQVLGRAARGAAAFVLVAARDGMLLGVGSDVMDISVAPQARSAAKQMCDKPVGREAWRVGDVVDHFDALMLRAWLVDDDERQLYQEGPATSIGSPADLARLCGDANELPARTIMVCGTPPLTGRPAAAPGFEVELEDPVLKRSLRHAYSIETLPLSG